MRDGGLISIFSSGRGLYVRTFGELPSVELTGFEFYCDDVAEGFVEELHWDSQSAHDGRLGIRVKLDARAILA